MFFSRDSRDGEEIEIDLVKQGDASAMRSLYERHIGYLTAVCSRYIVDEDDVKDVLQDSFVKVFTSIDRFEYRGKGSVRAWLTKVVVNESLAFLKESSRIEWVRSDEGLPDLPDEDPPDVTDISPETIQEMVQKLPEGYRTVFCLYVFEHKSHKEIAALLNIRADTSASQLHKAKNMLARLINDYKKEELWITG